MGALARPTVSKERGGTPGRSPTPHAVARVIYNPQFPLWREPP
jgi:hypothetical protein